MNSKSIKSKLGKFTILVLVSIIMFSVPSCLVLARKDNGKHKGWFKNKKNLKGPRNKKRGKGNESPSISNSLAYSKFPTTWLLLTTNDHEGLIELVTKRND